MRQLLLASLVLSLACGDDDSVPETDMGPVGVDAAPVDMGGGGTDMFTPETDLGPAVECLDEVADDTVETAQDLGDFDSDVGFPAGTAMGDIDPIVDLDWFQFHVEDVVLGDVQPRYSLSARPAGVIWELCVYYECDSGDTTFDCPDGSSEHMAGDLAGCCAVSSEGTPSISLSPACSDTISEDGTAYARVSRQGGVVTCEGYTLSYGDE